MATTTELIPGITVAICTYNRSRHLSDTLRDLSQQRAAADVYEILVVNNNSSDDTEQLLREQHLARWVTETRQGLSFARNRALQEAKRSYTLFIDDDVFLPEDFIGNWLQFITQFEGVKAAGGPISVHFDDGKPSWFPMVLAQMLGRHRAKKSGYVYPSGSFPHGGNMLLHTNTAIKNGAFHTGIGRTGAHLSAGEEKEFFRRLQQAGHVILHNPTSPLQHRVGNERLTRAYIARQARGIGHGDALVLQDTSSRKQWYGMQFIKASVSVFISLGYLLTLQPGRAITTIRFRKEVLAGFRSAVKEVQAAPSSQKHSSRGMHDE